MFGSDARLQTPETISGVAGDAWDGEELDALETSARVRWSDYCPDGLLADMLTRPRPAGADRAVADRDGADNDREAADFEALERIGAWERIIAWAQASQAREIAGFVSRAEARPPLGMEPAEAVDSAAAEVGLALRTAPRTAHQRVDQALALTRRLPATLAALDDGRVSLARARVIDDETRHLPPEHAAAVEGAVLQRAATQTPGQLRAATRRAVLRVDPEAARHRHARERQERNVRLEPEPDGMATLSAYLPAADARGVYASADEHARRAKQTGDERSMDARRADALVDLVLDCSRLAAFRQPVSPNQHPHEHPHRAAERTEPGGRFRPGTASGPSPTPRAPSRPTALVRVTVPATTLLRLDDQPGELAGYGPIPAETARELAADATWQRLLTDPVSGALVDYGTTRYTPPAHLAGHVTSRDQTCRFPGCRTPAHRCDLDHNTPHDRHAETGPTSAANLSAKCRHHHRLKHYAGWHATQDLDATITWTTPSGHIYTTAPPPLPHSDRPP